MSDTIKTWVRSIRWHSYQNVLREPDTFYQVHDAQDLETVTAARVAVVEQPPATAQRAVPAVSEALPVEHTTEAHVMTTSDMPTPRRRTTR